MVEMLFLTVPNWNVKIIFPIKINVFLYESLAEEFKKLNSYCNII